MDGVGGRAGGGARCSTQKIHAQRAAPSCTLYARSWVQAASVVCTDTQLSPETSVHCF